MKFENEQNQIELLSVNYMAEDHRSSFYLLSLGNVELIVFEF